jgi:hypothetical protein
MIRADQVVLTILQVALKLAQATVQLEQATMRAYFVTKLTVNWLRGCARINRQVTLAAVPRVKLGKNVFHIKTK